VLIYRDPLKGGHLNIEKACDRGVKFEGSTLERGYFKKCWNKHLGPFKYYEWEGGI
jgi:hypothetical protein